MAPWTIAMFRDARVGPGCVVSAFNASRAIASHCNTMSADKRHRSSSASNTGRNCFGRCCVGFAYLVRRCRWAVAEFRFNQLCKLLRNMEYSFNWRIVRLAIG
jgi:hypothetical protein